MMPGASRVRRGRSLLLATVAAVSSGDALEADGGRQGTLGISTLRRSVVRNAVGIGVATGAYALSFGAVSTSSGLSLLQTCVLSLLMFTGASQYGLVGVIGSGGSGLAGAATAILLGTRNAFYGLRISRLLAQRGPRRLLAAQLVIDESTAMSLATDSDDANRLGFWATGISVYVLWNLGTFIGAVAAQALPDPRAVGLDAAAPAAFVALLAPRVRSRAALRMAAGAAAVALACVPFLPIGGPILVAALAAIVVGGLTPGHRPAADMPLPEEPA